MPVASHCQISIAASGIGAPEVSRMRPRMCVICPLRVRGLAGHDDQIVVHVARPVGRVERAFGLHRRGDETGPRCHWRYTGDHRHGRGRDNAAHNMAAADLRREDARHEFSGVVGLDSSRLPWPH